MAHTSTPARSQLRLWRDHWQDEGNAAFLYRRIAAAEADRERAKVYLDLAQVEDQHIARWETVLRNASVRVPPHRPSLRARIMILIGRFFGWRLRARLLVPGGGTREQGH